VKVVADFAFYPIGVGVSLSSHIAACQQVFEEAGLAPQLHASGTNVEGEWDQVMAALKRCHEVLHDLGAPRVAATIRLGTRTDRDQSIADRIASVKAKR
jgi:uncharacterized protein (TIGR00106 family)